MNAAAFFAAVRAKPFGGSLSQNAVDGLTAIHGAWETYGDGDINKLAYIEATAFHEADRFKTMEEYASGAAYENRADLGNTQKGDGVRFKGRGFVQLTGRSNYMDWSKRLDLDLIGNPGLVTGRTVAARILVEGCMLGTFTGHELGDYIGRDLLLTNPPQPKVDFTNARRVINGTDKATLIKGYADAFLSALKAAGFGETVPAPANLADVTARLDKLTSEIVALKLDVERLSA